MGKRLCLVLACFIMAVGMAFAQKTVSGTVYDSSTGEPVIGAAVMVKGTTSIGAATDVDGKFTITNAPNDAQFIHVSYLGMKTKEVKIKENAMKVFLDPDVKMTDEVMVVAYGTATRETFTGSAGVIDAEILENRQVSNISNAFSGTVAGVQTLSSNGQPGTGSTVLVRGIGSLNSNVKITPLYVVDGVPYDGDLNALPTQDIESMTVLKDAAAAALYGARGANGVVLVTTKNGKRGDAVVTFDAKWGVNSRQVKNYDVLTSASEYMKYAYQGLYNAAYYTAGKSHADANAYANENIFSSIGYRIYTLPEGEGLFGLDGNMNPNAKLGYSDGTYYYTPDNWEDGSIIDGNRQEYSLSVSGGNEKVNYYFSAGYLEDEGIIRNSAFERMSTRLKVDYQAKDWLKLSTNLSYANTVSNYPSEQTDGYYNSSANTFGIAYNIAPVYPMYVRNAEGNLVYDASSGHVVYDYGDGKSTNNSRAFMSISNPTSDLIYSTEDYLVDNFNGNWSAELTPLKGLKLTATLGLHLDNTRNHSLGSSKYGQNAAYGGMAMQYSARISGWNQQYLANYKTSYKDHSFDLLAGFESYEYNYEWHYGYRYNIYKEGDFTINNGIDNHRAYGGKDKYTTAGFLGRLNYDYANKYFGSLSVRRDASSRFHKDNRWGTFWSASAAWDLAKEKFITNNASWIDLLKVKASYGQQGNDNIGNGYAYADQFSVTGANGVFSDGTLVYKGNPDLTWETSNAFNVGVDFTFWNKLNGTIEYFSRETSDMLYDLQVASSNGYSTIPVNVGSMTNSGWEISLDYTPFESDNFTWSIYGNATFIKNEINELHPSLNGVYESGAIVWREGESMYNRKYVQYAGVDKTNGQALYWAKRDVLGEDGETVVGEEEYVTTDWNAAYNTNRKETGDLLADVYGGFGTTLYWKGFDFGIQFAYQLGGKTYDYGYQWNMHGYTSADYGRNWHKDIRNAWTPENTDTDVPRLNSSDKYTNSSSDRWLISSNYLALNNITVGYTLPKSWTRKIGVEGVRIYFAADNVALWSAREGLDPRNGLASSIGSTYSTMRTMSGGVKFTF